MQIYTRRHNIRTLYVIPNLRTRPEQRHGGTHLLRLRHGDSNETKKITIQTTGDRVYHSSSPPVSTLSPRSRGCTGSLLCSPGACYASSAVTRGRPRRSTGNGRKPRVAARLTDSNSTGPFEPKVPARQGSSSRCPHRRRNAPAATRCS